MQSGFSVRRAWALLLAVAVLADTSAQAEPVVLPGGGSIERVDFERHVAGLLGSLGCNAGSCHGSFQGKGGFRLSLFGYRPDRDFLAITRDAAGRRLNRAEPDASLLLRKPTLDIAHGGGKRLERDSWQYSIVREWIAQGAERRPGSGTVAEIEIVPIQHTLERAGDALQLSVAVTFADGTRADMTPFCDFRVQDDAVADVLPSGEVRAVRPGDTAIIVSYRGHLATSSVLVPVPVEPGFEYPDVPPANPIDREVVAKLRALNVEPSELAGDADFLRRVTIDTIGCLPEPDEVRRFLVNDTPDKRTRKVDELLHHPLHAALWATRLCDVTAANDQTLEGPDELRPKRAKMWHDWFRARIAENAPYDEIVRGILCATSREQLDVAQWIDREIALVESARQGFSTDYADRAVLDLFWRRQDDGDFFPLEQMAELTATAFLGVRIECAQCHKHPFDRWTQADYRAWANIFSQVRFGSTPELRTAMYDLLEARRQPGVEPAERKPIPRLREIYLSDRPRRLPDPETGGTLAPKTLGGPVVDLDGDAREQLFAWLAEQDNPYFARSFVNRVWKHYFGIGLVEPVDGFSVANPPSNARLLDWLARDFQRAGYDIRRLERLILTSRTYQLSSTPGATNVHDRRNYARAYVRPMMAEVVVDVLNAALGVRGDFGPDVPAGVHAVEIAPSRVQDARLARVLRVFGRPERTSNCDCQRLAEPAVPQTLMLMSDETLLKAIAEGRLARLLEQERSDEQIVEELFLATLSRFPTETEARSALEHVQGKPDRKAALADVLWALINTREFITNH